MDTGVKVGSVQDWYTDVLFKEHSSAGYVLPPQLCAMPAVWMTNG